MENRTQSIIKQIDFELLKRTFSFFYFFLTSQKQREREREREPQVQALNAKWIFLSWRSWNKWRRLTTTITTQIQIQLLATRSQSNLLCLTGHSYRKNFALVLVAGYLTSWQEKDWRNLQSKKLTFQIRDFEAFFSFQTKHKRL